MAASKKSSSARKGISAKKNKNTQAQRRSMGVELLGLGIVCVAVVSFVVLLSSDNPSNAIRSLLEGLGGKLSFAIPFIILWVGVLTLFFGSKQHDIPRIFMTSGCILFFFSMVHLFYSEQIMSRLQLGGGWLNFIEQSFFDRAGTGALGALLAYPVYKYVGQWGGLIVFLFAILGFLVLITKISIRQIGEKAHDYLQTSYSDFRQHQSERASIRAERREQYEENRRARMQDWASWDDAVFLDEKDASVESIAPMDSVRYSQTESRTPLFRKDDKLEVPEYLKKRRRAKPILGENPESSSERATFSSTLSTPPTAESVEESRADSTEKYVSELTSETLAPRQDVSESSTDSNESPLGLSSSESTDFFAADEPLDIPESSAVSHDESLAYSDASAKEPEDLSSSTQFDSSFSPFDLESPVSRERKRRVLGEPVHPSAPRAEDTPKESISLRLDRTPLVMPAKPAETSAESMEEYNYPPVDLLSLPKQIQDDDRETRDREKAAKLAETLKNFGINAKLTGIAHGPAVTRFELAPAPGVKVSRITSLSDDIALSLAALSVRIEAPIPGKAAVGVEIPNETVETVPLREVLESSEARKHPSRLAVGMGKDNSGRYIVGDIAKMPHVLIAGATGSGKSVCINCIICSILYRATPAEVRLIMIDPKVVELSIYNGIPHLLVPVVTDPKKASGALQWAVAEMTDRYKKFAERGVRDMKGYNLSCSADEKPLPQIVIIIDELADLMMVTPGEVEDSICRLAQLARAAGIHLVIATQRPSVNVITGVIKANIPARIAFTVSSFVDSRTILDVGGAEKLLGRGDMLFAPSGSNKMQRVQGAWVNDDEVHSIVEYIKSRHDVEYNEDIMEHMNKAEDVAETEAEEHSDECDELLQQAIEIAVESGQASISMLQRRLRIGYARAGRLIDEMAARGIISQSEGAKPRTLLITREQYNAMFRTDSKA